MHQRSTVQVKSPLLSSHAERSLELPIMHRPKPRIPVKISKMKNRAKPGRYFHTKPLLIERRNAWQLLAFHVFQQGATAGRYIRHLVAITQIINSRG